MNDRKPAFKKTERPHPAAPSVDVAPAANGAAASSHKTTSPAAPRTPSGAANKHKNPGYVQLNARVPAEIRQRLRVLVAQNEDVQLSDHVERALVAYLDSLAR